MINNIPYEELTGADLVALQSSIEGVNGYELPPITEKHLDILVSKVCNNSLNPSDKIINLNGRIIYNNNGGFFGFINDLGKKYLPIPQSSINDYLVLPQTGYYIKYEKPVFGLLEKIDISDNPYNWGTPCKILSVEEYSSKTVYSVDISNIYVKVNTVPKQYPYYVFSYTYPKFVINNAGIINYKQIPNLVLKKGVSYNFIIVGDKDKNLENPFKIGTGWRENNSGIVFNEISGNEFKQISFTIPYNYTGKVRYYNYNKKNSISNINLIENTDLNINSLNKMYLDSPYKYVKISSFLYDVSTDLFTYFNTGYNSGGLGIDHSWDIMPYIKQAILSNDPSFDELSDYNTLYITSNRSNIDDFWPTWFIKDTENNYVYNSINGPYTKREDWNIDRHNINNDINSNKSSINIEFVYTRNNLDDIVNNNKMQQSDILSRLICQLNAFEISDWYDGGKTMLYPRPQDLLKIRSWLKNTINIPSDMSGVIDSYQGLGDRNGFIYYSLYPSVLKSEISYKNAEYTIENSSYDKPSRKLTLKIENIGDKDGIGYSNADWTTILEVTKDISLSETVGAIQAGTPLRLLENNTIVKYYAVRKMTINTEPLLLNSTENLYTIQKASSDNNINQYIINKPPLKSHNSITIEVTLDYEFDDTKIYAAFSDDGTYSGFSHGDTPNEQIETLSIGTNNIFIWNMTSSNNNIVTVQPNIFDRSLNVKLKQDNQDNQDKHMNDIYKGKVNYNRRHHATRFNLPIDMTNIITGENDHINDAQGLITYTDKFGDLNNWLANPLDVNTLKPGTSSHNPYYKYLNWKLWSGSSNQHTIRQSGPSSAKEGSNYLYISSWRITPFHSAILVSRPIYLPNDGSQLKIYINTYCGTNVEGLYPHFAIFNSLSDATSVSNLNISSLPGPGDGTQSNSSWTGILSGKWTVNDMKSTTSGAFGTSLCTNANASQWVEHNLTEMKPEVISNNLGKYLRIYFEAKVKDSLQQGYGDIAIDHFKIIYTPASFWSRSVYTNIRLHNSTPIPTAITNTEFETWFNSNSISWRDQIKITRSDGLVGWGYIEFCKANSFSFSKSTFVNYAYNFCTQQGGGVDCVIYEDNGHYSDTGIMESAVYFHKYDIAYLPYKEHNSMTTYTYLISMHDLKMVYPDKATDLEDRKINDAQHDQVIDNFPEEDYLDNNGTRTQQAASQSNKVSHHDYYKSSARISLNSNFKDKFDSNLRKGKYVIQNNYDNWIFPDDHEWKITCGNIGIDNNDNQYGPIGAHSNVHYLYMEHTLDDEVRNQSSIYLGAYERTNSTGDLTLKFMYNMYSSNIIKREELNQNVEGRTNEWKLNVYIHEQNIDESRNETTIVKTLYMKPYSFRRWEPVSINLSAFTGDTIFVEFEGITTMSTMCIAIDTVEIVTSPINIQIDNLFEYMKIGSYQVRHNCIEKISTQEGTGGSIIELYNEKLHIYIKDSIIDLTRDYANYKVNEYDTKNISADIKVSDNPEFWSLWTIMDNNGRYVYAPYSNYLSDESKEKLYESSTLRKTALDEHRNLFINNVNQTLYDLRNTASEDYESNISSLILEIVILNNPPNNNLTNTIKISENHNVIDKYQCDLMAFDLRKNDSNNKAYTTFHIRPRDRLVLNNWLNRNSSNINETTSNNRREPVNLYASIIPQHYEVKTQQSTDIYSNHNFYRLDNYVIRQNIKDIAILIGPKNLSSNYKGFGIDPKFPVNSYVNQNFFPIMTRRRKRNIHMSWNWFKKQNKLNHKFWKYRTASYVKVGRRYKRVNSWPTWFFNDSNNNLVFCPSLWNEKLFGSKKIYVSGLKKIYSHKQIANKFFTDTMETEPLDFEPNESKVLIEIVLISDDTLPSDSTKVLSNNNIKSGTYNIISKITCELMAFDIRNYGTFIHYGQSQFYIRPRDRKKLYNWMQINNLSTTESWDNNNTSANKLFYSLTTRIPIITRTCNNIIINTEAPTIKRSIWRNYAIKNYISPWTPPTYAVIPCLVRQSLSYHFPKRMLHPNRTTWHDNREFHLAQMNYREGKWPSQRGDDPRWGWLLNPRWQCGIDFIFEEKYVQHIYELCSSNNINDIDGFRCYLQSQASVDNDITSTVDYKINNSTYNKRGFDRGWVIDHVVRLRRIYNNQIREQNLSGWFRHIDFNPSKKYYCLTLVTPSMKENYLYHKDSLRKYIPQSKPWLITNDRITLSPIQCLLYIENTWNKIFMPQSSNIDDNLYGQPSYEYNKFFEADNITHIYPNKYDPACTEAEFFTQASDTGSEWKDPLKGTKWSSDTYKNAAGDYHSFWMDSTGKMHTHFHNDPNKYNSYLWTRDSISNHLPVNTMYW